MPIGRNDVRLDAAAIAEYTSAGYWSDETLTSVLRENADQRPDGTAFVDEERATTWGALWKRSRELAAHLQQLGIGPGEVVAVQLPNRIEFVEIFAAASHLGAVVCQFPAEYRAAEVRSILSTSEAAVVFVQASYKGVNAIETVDEVRAQLPHLRHTIALDSDDDLPASWTAFEQLDDHVTVDEAALAEDEPGGNDIMRITFTSGSTGNPKAVVHTYNTTLFTNRGVNELWGIGETSRLLLFTPLALNSGLFRMMQSIIAGCTLHLCERFDPERVLDLIEQRRITHVGSPPTATLALIGSPKFQDADTSSLQAIIAGGTPFQVLRQAAAAFDCPIIEIYGSLEMGWACSPRPDETTESIGTAGRPFPWLSIKIVELDAENSVGQIGGEIAVRGPSVCVGYYHNKAANATSWTDDDYFLSGDIGYFDDDGRLHITGRKKDMIRHGGRSIFPAEIEETIYSHPKVRAVSVVGLPDGFRGERICACVVLAADQELDLDELLGYLRPLIAKYKLPQRLEIFDRFPLTPTGKISKPEIRSILGSGNGSGQL